MPVRSIMILDGIPGTTVALASTDASRNLVTDDNLVMINSDGKLIHKILMTPQTNSISYCFTSTPLQGAPPVLGHIRGAHSTSLGEFWLVGADAIRAFNYISAVNGSASTFSMTPFYSH